MKNSPLKRHSAIHSKQSSRSSMLNATDLWKNCELSVWHTSSIKGKGFERNSWVAMSFLEGTRTRINF